MDKPSRFTKDGILSFEEREKRESKKEEEGNAVPMDLASFIASDRTKFLSFMMMLRGEFELNKPVSGFPFLIRNGIKADYQQAVWVNEGIRVFYMKLLTIGFHSFKQKGSSFSEEDYINFLKTTDNVFPKKKACSNIEVINFSEYALKLYPFLYQHFGIEYGLQAERLPSYFFRQGILRGMYVLEQLAKKNYFTIAVHKDKEI